MSATSDPELVPPADEPSARTLFVRRLVAALAVLSVFAICAPYYVNIVRDQTQRAWAGLHYSPPASRGMGFRGEFMAGIRTARPGQVVAVVRGGGAERAGITTRDTVKSVAGITVADSASRAALVALAARSRPGDTLPYQIRNPTGERTVSVRFGSPLDAPRAFSRIVLYAIACVLFLGIGLFVYIRRSHDLRAFVFLHLSVCAAISLLLTPAVSLDPLMSGIVPGPGVGVPIVVAIVIYCLCAVIFLSLLLHFALIFPREQPVLARNPALVSIVYWGPYLFLFAAGMMPLGIFLSRGRNWIGPAVAVASLAPILWAGRGRWKKNWIVMARMHPFFTAAVLSWIGFTLGGLLMMAPRTIPVVTGARVALILLNTIVYTLAYFGSLVAMAIAVVFILLRSYRESRLEERQQIRWPLWSLLANVIGGAFLLVVTSILTMRFGSQSQTQLDLLNDLLQLPLTLLIPTGFAIAILRYRLLDLDLVIRKTAIYGSVTAMLLLLQFAVVGGLGAWFAQRFAIQSHWLTAFGTLAVAALFVPARNRVQRVVDRRFYRTRYVAAESHRRISALIASSADRATLGRAVGEELAETLRVRSFALLVQDDDARALVPAAAVGLSENTARELRVVPDRDTTSRLATGAPIAARDAGGALFAAARMARAELVVPLTSRRGIAGAMLVGGKLSEEEFDESDRDYLSTVGGQLAAGLANLESPARKRELEEARKIQAGLLPRSLPKIAGFDVAASWQPAQEVAGDYYDVLELTDGRVGFCIADVTGKGMPAALLMSNLQAALKSTAAAVADPKAVNERVNRIMAANTSPGRFITMFYGVLDPLTRRLVYTNAGHNPPLLVRADASVIPLEAGGLLLGVFPEAEFVEGDVVLGSGDRLVLFTDGLTEAMTTNGELFGDDRLIETLRDLAPLGAEELRARLMGIVSSFCDGEFQDDATVVVVASE